MKKWQTALVAILPISLLFIIMNLLPKIEAMFENQGVNKAIQAFIDLENYTYQLDFGLKYGKDVTRFRISEQVVVNHLDQDHKREYHNIMVTSMDNQDESIRVQYMTDSDPLEGFLVNHSTMPGWFEVDKSTVSNFKYDFSSILRESIRYNLETAERVNEQGNLEAYRIYQETFQNEPWFQNMTEQEAKMLLNIHAFRDEPYYMDIVVDTGTNQIDYIRFEASALADYLSVVNGYVTYHVKTIESINLNYLMTNIQATDEKIELPAYMPINN